MTQFNQTDFALRSPESNDGSSASRLLIVDPSIQGMKGHFLELALVIADAASRRGYAPWLATSLDFAEHQVQLKNVRVVPVFSCNKIRRWSLGPHGYSRLRRNLSAEPIGSLSSKLLQRLVDRLHGKSPQKVLEATKRELVSLLEQFRPLSSDHILFSTADDFVLLIVAAAIKDLPLARDCKLSFLWHNPVTSGRACEMTTAGKREQQTKEQLIECFAALKNVQVQFFSTTEELRFQYESQVLADRWTAVEYPIRSTFRLSLEGNAASHNALSSVLSNVKSMDESAAPRTKPFRVICGGGQRSEKGANFLNSLVKSLWNDFLVTRRIRLGLQLDAGAAKKLVTSLPQSPLKAPVNSNVLDISNASLNAEEYLAWIRSADIGLFLYDSRRYYTRCSGVLIEMLACGKPVIVPAGCWLSRQIATFNNEYLMRIESQSYGPAVVLFQSVPLTTDKTKAHEFWLHVDSSPMMLTFQIENATEHSYIAIESATQTPSGVTSTRWHILELIDRECRLLLRSDSKSPTETQVTRLRIWSPYGERGLVISSVKSKERLIDCGTVASSAVGITFARMEDLPACVDEVVTNYQSYADQVQAFQPRWVEQHSGDQFVAKVLLSTAPLVCSEN